MPTFAAEILTEPVVARLSRKSRWSLGGPVIAGGGGEEGGIVVGVVH